MSDIVWVYPKRTQHYYYFIPTGKSHAIVIADEIGRRVEGDLGRGGSSEKRAQEFIGEISARIPWVITGYSEELKSLYDKHRSDFVKIVQERQQQYQNQTR